MCTQSSPARAPKSQLAVEQPSTGTLEPTKKKKTTSNPRTKEKPHQNGRRGTIIINQILHPLGGQLTNRRRVIPEKFWHCREVSNPTSGSPAWGPSEGTGNPQGT